MSALEAALDLLCARPATLGAGRLVCIDGPAGSGKSTLAGMLAEGFDKLNHRGDKLNHRGDKLNHRGDKLNHREDKLNPRGARVVHMDDLFPGWSGLSRVDEQLDDLLTPLAGGRAGSYRRYDWLADAFAETLEVEPVPLLVLEGVGSGASRFDPLRTVLVWVEAPYDVRMRRGIERDGDAFAPHWDRWAADERDLFARERTRERADLVVDGTRSY